MSSPKLRFKGFSDEWRIENLENVFSIFNGYAFSSTDSLDQGVLWVKIADVGIQEMKRNNLSYLPLHFKEIHKKFLLKTGDFVVALTRPILNGKLKIGQIDEFFNDSLLNQRVGKLQSNNCLKFVTTILQRDSLIKEIENNIAGTDPPNLSPAEIRNIKISVPTLPEQEKIATFFTAIDQKLNLLKEKKEKLERYKKGVMQQIFSQQLRFKDEQGNNFPEWESYQLNDILSEHKTRNKDNQVKEVFSVAKNKGVINQIEHLGRSYASKDVTNYKVSFPDDVIYTKSPTSDFPFGIIKQNKTGRTGIVSTLYGVFKPKTKYLGFILDYYFSTWENTFNYLNPLVEKGAKNTMNINNDRFLNGDVISLPSDEVEQKKITDFIKNLDAKINLVETQIQKTELWKKGLLQQMFV